MTEATVHFPRGFLWGTATAAHQVEGGNTNNNWHAWEQQEGRIRNGDKSGLACDWWGGRWKEDLDRAAETGQNAHRFSIEWSRIQPAPDRWDEEALERYRLMLRGMLERGLTPMVTLHHFSNPIWLEEQGGWENDATPQKFALFVQKSVEALKEYVTYWVTINEPNVYAFGAYVEGTFPPGKKDLNAALPVMVNLARGHALAYKVIHELQPEARVGLSMNYRSIFPASGSPLDKWMAGFQAKAFNDMFPRAAIDGNMRLIYKTVKIPEMVKTQDFLGVNYYTRDLISFDLRHSGSFFGHRYYRPDAELSGTGFLALEPDGFMRRLNGACSSTFPCW